MIERRARAQLQATVTDYSNGSISQESYQLHSCNYEKTLEEVFHRAFSERDLDLGHLASRIIQNLDLKPPVVWFFITTTKVTKQRACGPKLSQLCLLCLELFPSTSQTRKAVEPGEKTWAVFSHPTGHLGLCPLCENKVQAEHIYHEATLPCAPVGKPVCSVTNVIKPANDSTQT